MGKKKDKKEEKKSLKKAKKLAKKKDKRQNKKQLKAAVEELMVAEEPAVEAVIPEEEQPVAAEPVEEVVEPVEEAVEEPEPVEEAAAPVPLYVPIEGDALKTVSIKMPVGLIEAADKASKVYGEGVSRSEFIRIAIEKLVNA